MNDVMRDKYITLISKASDKYGNRLIEMMDYYSVNCLADLTAEQCKQFYERNIR